MLKALSWMEQSVLSKGSYRLPHSQVWGSVWTLKNRRSVEIRNVETRKLHPKIEFEDKTPLLKTRKLKSSSFVGRVLTF